MSTHSVLSAEQHGALRVRTDADPALGDGVMAALAVPAEFRRLQAHYPLVFRRDAATGTVSALALFGFEPGENLFLTADGRWDAAEKPLSQAVQPFLIGLAQDGGEPQVHIDMDHPRVSLGDEGTRVFDDAGAPTPLLEKVAERLGDLHEGYGRSAGFYAALERHALLEPFTLNVPRPGAEPQTLVGFQIIDEERLASLDGAALAELHREGHLSPIFMAIASLSQFPALIARKLAR